MEADAPSTAHWNWDGQMKNDVNSDDDDDDDESSIVSGGSEITIETVILPSPPLATELPPTVVTPSTPTHLPATFDFALMETPPDKRKNMRKSPDDCHVLIRWSELVGLVKNNFRCLCGEPIEDFRRQTIGIATNIEFRCGSCRTEASALADPTNYAQEK